MSANHKKDISRNAKTLFTEGTVCRVTDRNNPLEDEAVGEAVVLSTTREEIRAEVRGRRFGFEGVIATFRIPTLTQRGGNLRLCLP